MRPSGICSTVSMMWRTFLLILFSPNIGFFVQAFEYIHCFFTSLFDFLTQVISVCEKDIWQLQQMIILFKH